MSVTERRLWRLTILSSHRLGFVLKTINDWLFDWNIWHYQIVSEEIEVGEMEVWSVPSRIFHLPFRRKLERDSLSYDLITLWSRWGTFLQIYFETTCNVWTSFRIIWLNFRCIFLFWLKCVWNKWTHASHFWFRKPFVW